MLIHAQLFKKKGIAAPVIVNLHICAKKDSGYIGFVAQSVGQEANHFYVSHYTFFPCQKGIIHHSPYSTVFSNVIQIGASPAFTRQID